MIFHSFSIASSYPWCFRSDHEYWDDRWCGQFWANRKSLRHSDADAQKKSISQKRNKSWVKMSFICNKFGVFHRWQNGWCCGCGVAVWVCVRCHKRLPSHGKDNLYLFNFQMWIWTRIAYLCDVRSMSQSYRVQYIRNGFSCVWKRERERERFSPRTHRLFIMYFILLIWQLEVINHCLKFSVSLLCWKRTQTPKNWKYIYVWMPNART